MGDNRRGRPSPQRTIQRQRFAFETHPTRAAIVRDCNAQSRRFVDTDRDSHHKHRVVSSSEFGGAKQMPRLAIQYTCV